MIYITGDTHGDYNISKLNSKNFHQGLSLTEEDYVIICGDCGCVWDNGKFDHYMQKWYNNKPWTTLFIDGNHENHDVLATYPVEIWNGGKIHRISPKIIHLMRGQVFTINNKTFFTMGGAESHDKNLRHEGVSWWTNEMPSIAEMYEGLDNLEKYNNQVDYILTHAAPDFFQDLINPYYNHNKLTRYLEVIRESTQFSIWFCGHYHIDQWFYTPTAKYCVLFNQVIKI